MKNNFKFYKSDLTKNTLYCGKYDMPYVKSSNEIPEDVIPFDKAIYTKNENDFNKWVIFYIDDYKFEKIWNNPNKYLNKLKKFKGVVTPDFSMTCDLPYPIKIMNSYRSKQIGSFLNENKVKTIPNIRWCDSESLEYSIDGIEKNSNIFIGTLGAVKKKENRSILVDGISRLCEVLEPKNIFFYGTLPEEIKKICENYEVNYKVYEPEIKKVFYGVNNGA